MSLFTKPTDHIDWTDGSTPTKVVEPSVGKKLLGWIAGERPAFQFMNWLFWQTDNWDKYEETVTDFLLQSGYKATIGTGGTFADINAAMASADILPGDRLLVISNLALAATQIITKANVAIDLMPGITISKAGAGTGIQFSAVGIRLKGGRISGFSGGGDKAILIDVGSNYFFIGEVRFGTNTTDISDLNGTGAQYAIVNE